jgi:hypothetical protein
MEVSAMKRLLILSCIFALAAATASAGETNESFGYGVTLEQAVPIETLLENPDDYVGKTIRVDGVITGVCKKRGCWMQVSNPETGQGVRIKVEDGVIVFPYTAMGLEASAEGVFEAIKLSPEQIEARRKAAHDHAEGEDCDRAEPKKDGSGMSCEIEPVNEYVYMIRGTGAVITG